MLGENYSRGVGRFDTQSGHQLVSLEGYQELEHWPVMGQPGLHSALILAKHRDPVSTVLGEFDCD